MDMGLMSMRCIDAAGAVTNLREGGLNPVRALRVQRHLSTCPDCRLYAAQLEVCASAAHMLASAALDPEHEALAMSAFRAWQKRRADLPSESQAIVRSPGYGRLVGAIGVAAVAGVVLARHHAPFGVSWILAGVLALLACALVPLARTRGLMVVGLALAAAALPLVLTQHGAFTWLINMPCVVHEVATAAIAVSALWFWHRDRASRSPSAAAGVAALGALAGDASLHVTCQASSSFLHVLVFHVGGVVLAAAIAGMIAARYMAPRGALS
jgi:hypothetical protein